MKPEYNIFFWWCMLHLLKGAHPPFDSVSSPLLLNIQPDECEHNTRQSSSREKYQDDHSTFGMWKSLSSWQISPSLIIIVVAYATTRASCKSLCSIRSKRTRRATQTTTRENWGLPPQEVMRRGIMAMRMGIIEDENQAEEGGRGWRRRMVSVLPPGVVSPYLLFWLSLFSLFSTFLFFSIFVILMEFFHLPEQTFQNFVSIIRHVKFERRMFCQRCLDVQKNRSEKMHEVSAPHDHHHDSDGDGDDERSRQKEELIRWWQEGKGTHTTMIFLVMLIIWRRIKEKKSHVMRGEIFRWKKGESQYLTDWPVMLRMELNGKSDERNRSEGADEKNRGGNERRNLWWIEMFFSSFLPSTQVRHNSCDDHHHDGNACNYCTDYWPVISPLLTLPLLSPRSIQRFF